MLLIKTLSKSAIKIQEKTFYENKLIQSPINLQNTILTCVNCIFSSFTNLDSEDNGMIIDLALSDVNFSRCDFKNNIFNFKCSSIINLNACVAEFINDNFNNNTINYKIEVQNGFLNGQIFFY